MKKKTKNRPQTKLPRDPTANKIPSPVLRFSPTAWAKLLFLRDYGDTEVGGFGIAPSDDLLLVEDIQLVKQTCSWAHVAFDDESVADYFDAQVDAGRQPQQFARIWLHTHPGDCPRPSPTDEETFTRVFGRAEWAIMFILAQEGQSYARLRFNVGPGASTEIPVDVDYRRPFAGGDFDAWQQEYLSHIQPQRVMPSVSGNSPNLVESPLFDDRAADWYDDWPEYTGDDSELLKGGVYDLPIC